MEAADVHLELLGRDITRKDAEIKAARHKVEAAVTEAVKAKVMRDAFRDTAPEKSRLTTSYLVLLEQRKRLEQELRCVRLEKERLQKEKRNLEAKILIERKRREKKGRYVQKAVPVAGDNGKPIPRPHEEPLLPVKWQFGELPQVRTRFQLPADLPERLAVLLHVPPAMLRQLSLVKLRILARLYLKIFPKDHRTEDDLCEIMHTAIGAMVPGWQAATPHYVYGSRWNASVRLCIHHWLDGWAAGSTGRALNVCCHEACVVSADFLQVLSNPPDSLMNVFVTASMRPNIGLDALMVLLCARVVLVEVQDMPTDAKSLHQAVKAALVAAALRLEGIQRGPLLELQESATFGRMVYAIQSQLAVPLIVAFNGMQAIGYKEYERLFASTLDEFPRDVPSAILVQKARVFLGAVQAPLTRHPHLFYIAAGKSWDLAHLGMPGSLRPGAPPTYNTRVVRLGAIGAC